MSFTFLIKTEFNIIHTYRLYRQFLFIKISYFLLLHKHMVLFLFITSNPNKISFVNIFCTLLHCCYVNLGQQLWDGNNNSTGIWRKRWNGGIKERDECSRYWRGSSGELYWRFCLAWMVPLRATSNQSHRSHSLTLLLCLPSFLIALLISSSTCPPPPFLLLLSLALKVITAQSANQINSHLRGCDRPKSLTFGGKCHL